MLEVTSMLTAFLTKTGSFLTTPSAAIKFVLIIIWFYFPMHLFALYVFHNSLALSYLGSQSCEECTYWDITVNKGMEEQCLWKNS